MRALTIYCQPSDRLTPASGNISPFYLVYINSTTGQGQDQLNEWGPACHWVNRTRLVDWRWLVRQLLHIPQPICNHQDQDRSSPYNPIPYLEDIQHIMNSRLDNFLDSLTLDQETPFDEFAIWYLIVWPDQILWHMMDRKHAFERQEKDLD